MRCLFCPAQPFMFKAGSHTIRITFMTTATLTNMCLSCFDPIVSALRELNPFKSKRSRKINADKERVDRDNIEVPFVLEEKRPIICPDADHVKPNHNLRGTLKEETVLTMKKVSSLALV